MVVHRAIALLGSDAGGVLLLSQELIGEVVAGDGARAAHVVLGAPERGAEVGVALDLEHFDLPLPGSRDGPKSHVDVGSKGASAWSINVHCK